MALNPLELLKIKDRFSIFQSQHPKAISFLQDVAANAITEGSVIEIKVTTPDQKERVSNIRITQDDLKTIEILKNIRP